MRRTVLALAAMLVAGCGGEPRYGGRDPERVHAGLYHAVADVLAAAGPNRGDMGVTTALEDLDGDGDLDGLAVFATPWFCSTRGCELMAFENEGDRFRALRQGTDVMALGEVRVDTASTNGWRHLLVEVAGPADRTDSTRVARLRYDDESDALVERLPADEAPPAPVTAEELDRSGRAVLVVTPGAIPSYH